MEGGARWATVHGVTIVSLLCGQASLGNSCSVYIFCFTHGCLLHLYPIYVTHLPTYLPQAPASECSYQT